MRFVPGLTALPSACPFCPDFALSVLAHNNGHDPDGYVKVYRSSDSCGDRHVYKMPTRRASATARRRRTRPGRPTTLARITGKRAA